MRLTLVEPTCGVGQDQVGPPGCGVLDGVEDDGAGVAPLVAPDHLGPDPVGPHRQLIGRRSAEGVTGRHDHGVPGRRVAQAQLADGRGLAHAVDPDEEPDGHALPGQVQRPVPLQDGRQVTLERLEQQDR
jgi:hypothetical protein